MNAVLQVLSHTDLFRSFILSLGDDMADFFRKTSAPVTLLPRLTRRQSKTAVVSENV
jgi:hypothetical protein